MALLEGLREDPTPVVSWSTVTAPALVLGRTPAGPAVDPAAAEAQGVAVVRRSSGGGPVLWDAGLLALDVALPREHPLAPPDVVEGYRWLGGALADALAGLGVPGVRTVSVAAAREAARFPNPASGACYGGLSPHEVLVEGRKAVGLAQARRRQGTLLQAGILMSLDAGRLARLLGDPPGFADALRAMAGGLDEVVPGLGELDVIAAVDARLEAALGGGCTGAGAGT